MTGAPLSPSRHRYRYTRRSSTEIATRSILVSGTMIGLVHVGKEGVCGVAEFDEEPLNCRCCPGPARSGAEDKYEKVPAFGRLLNRSGSPTTSATGCLLPGWETVSGLRHRVHLPGIHLYMTHGAEQGWRAVNAVSACDQQGCAEEDQRAGPLLAAAYANRLHLCPTCPFDQFDCCGLDAVLRGVPALRAVSPSGASTPTWCAGSKKSTGGCVR